MNKGRRRIELTPREINKINLMYYLNNRKVSEIARALGCSASIVERNLCPSKKVYEEWYEVMKKVGEL